MKHATEIDALFTLPLSDFTAARNALAARLKKEGRSDEAAGVKSLPKPPATAWAVNQLHWRHRRELDRLFAISEKVRAAQTSKTPQLRSLLDERRRLVSQLADIAAEILSEVANSGSPEARRRIVTTLESLAAWGRSNMEVQAGRLTADLEPLGFDGLVAMMDGAAFQPAKVLDFPQKTKKSGGVDDSAARARAAERLRLAEKTLATARREAARTEALAAKATAKAAALEQEQREIEARRRAANENARAATQDAQKAARAVVEAERELATATKALR